MSLQVCTLILPKTFNDGYSTEEHLQSILKRILHTFGGFTSYDVQGSWIEWADQKTAEIYTDKSLKVEIAMSAEDHQKLRDIAQYAALILEQKCVFMSTPSGVEFVESDPRREEVA